MEDPGRFWDPGMFGGSWEIMGIMGGSEIVGDHGGSWEVLGIMGGL